MSDSLPFSPPIDCINDRVSNRSHPYLIPDFSGSASEVLTGTVVFVAGIWTFTIYQLKQVRYVSSWPRVPQSITNGC